MCRSCKRGHAGSTISSGTASGNWRHDWFRWSWSCQHRWCWWNHCFPVAQPELAELLAALGLVAQVAKVPCVRCTQCATQVTSRWHGLPSGARVLYLERELWFRPGQHDYMCVARGRAL